MFDGVKGSAEVQVATSTVGLPESEAVKILFKVKSREVSVEYKGL